MHVGFNCRLQCGLSGSGVRWGMRSGTANRQAVCMVVRLCAWLSGCVHGCQVVCMVVYRTWCGCRECATCVLSRPTVSHITCWLPFVLCVLDLIIVPCANYFVYLK